MDSFGLTIVGAPVTKKNSQRMIPARTRTGKTFWRPIASKANKRWEAAAIPQARVQWTVLHGHPLRAPCRVTATFFRARRVGDLINFEQAVADMLQKAGVVADDKWIVSWDGSTLDSDPKRPRIELLITPLETTT